MTPLPADSTARVKIKYTTCGTEHTVQVRFVAPHTVAEVITAFSNFVHDRESLFYLSSVIDVQVAEVLSNVFNSYGGDWPTAWGSGAGSVAAAGQFLDFIGRSTDGRRARLALFGAKVVLDSDGLYRLLSADDTNIADMVNILATATGLFLSINGFQPVWKPYADSGLNAYWRNHTRG